MVIFDRFGAYSDLPFAQRQLGWAHLKRDFQAMAERAGPAKAVGEGLLGVVTNLFWCWRRVREGKRDRAWFQRQVAAKFRPHVERRLLRGLESGVICSRCGTYPSIVPLLNVVPAAGGYLGLAMLRRSKVS